MHLAQRPFKLFVLSAKVVVPPADGLFRLGEFHYLFSKAQILTVELQVVAIKFVGDLIASSFVAWLLNCQLQRGTNDRGYFFVKERDGAFSSLRGRFLVGRGGVAYIDDMWS